MFTGIVAELGEVAGIEQRGDAARLTIRGSTEGVSPGDSIAVNGVCLTVTGILDGTFTADVMGETLDRSGLGALTPGAPVNLEQSVRLADRLGGHLVQGHVDGTGTIISRSPADHWDQVRISLPAGISRYVVHKGSIAVDGISLTVSALGPPGDGPDGDTWFEVCLIPETLKRTTMGARQPGEVVNLEVDVIAKYVERLAERGGNQVNQVFDDVDRAIKDIAEGRPVVVVDDADRENEGDIILAASLATPELLAFMIRYTSGVICVPLPGAELDRLHLPLMTSQNTEHMRTAFTLSVDAREGVSTGISAADRATTIARLVDPTTTAQDLVRPGHVFPLRYAEGGVLRRPGHTEAAVDLARLAGLPPAGVLAEVVNDDGTMARLPELREFATAHDLALISIEQLVEYRRRTERQLTREAQTKLPNAFGLWQAYGYRHEIDGTEYVALVLGDVADGADVLTRLHSECLTGDVFGSLRCDCGAQLEAAMAAIAAEGRGIVLYLRGHEGRGVGLLSKLRAYELQDAGADTVDANLELGLPADAREYSAGAQMLADLGVRSVRLLTNNPAKVSGLTGCGVDVTARVPLTTAVTPYNLRYLTTKRDKLGHQIQNLNDSERTVVLPPAQVRAESA